MKNLPIHLDIAGRPVPLVGSGPAADAKARLIAAAGGTPVVIAADAAPQPAPADALIAFIALEDADRASRWRAHFRGQGLLVNVVDTPALCDFSVPAIVDRGQVVISLGTGGASASLAKALRERLEVWLPEGLGELADAIRAARADVAAIHASVAVRRAFWDSVLAPGGALDPLAQVTDPAAALKAALAASPPAGGRERTLTLASADPDDLTLRQLRLLQQADLIVHARDVPPAVLALARRDADRMAMDAPRVDAAQQDVLSAQGLVLRVDLAPAASG